MCVGVCTDIDKIAYILSEHSQHYYTQRERENVCIIIVESSEVGKNTLFHLHNES